MRFQQGGILILYFALTTLCSVVLGDGLVKAQERNTQDSLATVTQISGGELQLKRQGEQSYRRATVNMQLMSGDLLLPDPDAQVELRCYNGSTASVPRGVASGVNNLCPPPRAPESTNRSTGFFDFLRMIFGDNIAPSGQATQSTGGAR